MLVIIIATLAIVLIPALVLLLNAWQRYRSIIDSDPSRILRPWNDTLAVYRPDPRAHTGQSRLWAMLRMLEMVSNDRLLGRVRLAENDTSLVAEIAHRYTMGEGGSRIDFINPTPVSTRDEGVDIILRHWDEEHLYGQIRASAVEHLVS